VSQYEVPQPILNSPYEQPGSHWELAEGQPPVKRDGRRQAMYWYRPPTSEEDESGRVDKGTAILLLLVNRIRERVKAWRGQGWPGVSRTTLELLQHWRREGRNQRLFFAQIEATETIIFMTEARADFRQGIEIPRDEPSADRKAEGYTGFLRHACKMATGAGKTTVMGMLAAWSILNKVHDRSDARFSDAVLVVCPNVTIRSRLAELDPRTGDASLYRKRDLVPVHMMPDLAQGRVLVTNWHVFEPREVQTAGVSAKVSKAGKAQRFVVTIHIGQKTTSARGKRYATLEDLGRQVDAGLVSVMKEDRDKQGNIKSVQVEGWRYIESDAALVRRVLGREIGNKQNILVFNDEAHHAYRIRSRPKEEEELDEEEDEVDGDEEFEKEATVWVEGLDRIQKHRGIKLCVDLSATPYFLKSSGPEANRPFPWVVSDFGLTDAIESGLVKIPQLAVRDTTGAEIPGYFNIWRWILPRLTATERGGRRGTPKPEAILKYAQPPLLMLGGLWKEKLDDWQKQGETRPPVFIVVCKNTKISKVVFEWIAEGKAPYGIPTSKLDALFNRDGKVNTIRVDTRVVQETDSDTAKSDESAWMRFTLDTIGRQDWPRDTQDRPIHPDTFEELAQKLGRPLHPPGRDVRCIVSVGMLTEGWDCNTVTHIVGLRPFMSQLLCEQVVGRALRRSSYMVGDDGLLQEEVAQVLGVPFEVIPLKQNKGEPPKPPPKRHHVVAIPARASFEITFPRVEGYRQTIRNRVEVDWKRVPTLVLDPLDIPAETQLKAMLPGLQSRPSLHAPGSSVTAELTKYTNGLRQQELCFDIARGLTAEYCAHNPEQVAPHVLFPQLVEFVRTFLQTKVEARRPFTIQAAGISPYYGQVVERLAQAIHPDTKQGEAPEVPCYETSRGPGTTAEVDFWTSKEVRELEHSHLNYVVADTRVWEQAAAYILDTHELVRCFAKNAGLGFSIPYLHNGEAHEYLPDFLIRFDKGDQDAPSTLILETKGYDTLRDVKEAAAARWVRAVNADGRHGIWAYRCVGRTSDIDQAVRDARTELANQPSRAVGFRGT
jgi:type III restriction enzyme